MDRTLVIASVVVGLALWGSGFAPPAPTRRVGPLWQAALPALLGFLLSLPQTGAFAMGQALGIGLLLGGIVGVLALWQVEREKPETAAGILVAAQAGVLLWQTTFPVDSTLGLALGVVATGITACLLRRESELAGRLAAPLVLGAALAAAVGLGTYRNSHHAPYAISLVAIGLVLARLLALIPLAWLRGGLLVVAIGLAARFLSTALLGGSWVFVGLVTMGVLLALLLPLLLPRDDTELVSPLLPGLVALAFAAVAGHLAQGFGIALGALGLVVGTVLSGERRLFAPLLLVALLGLYRFCAQRWWETRGLGIAENAVLVSFLVGATVPAWLGRWAALRSASPSTAASGLGIGVAGIVALAAPTVIVILYGPHGGIALVLGLVAGALLTANEPLSLFLRLATALALVQTMGHLAQLAEGSRLDRLKLVAGIALVTGVLVAVSAALARRTPSTGAEETT